MINEMSEKKKALIIVMALIVILLILNGKWLIFCDSSIEGQVVDSETHKPLEGVVVVGLWELTQFFSHGSGGYAKISLVETDSNGKFKLPYWLTFKPWTLCSSTDDLSPVIIIYRPGYKLYWSQTVMRAGFAGSMIRTVEEQNQLREEYSINPAKLKRIFTDEERIQNYRDWGTHARFPGPHYPKNISKIINKALVEEMRDLSEKYKDKYLLIKSLQN